jgi:AGCS family alanine or glycine:cation symporter
MSLTDYLNSKFKPAVEILDKIIFWDIADALGLDLGAKVPFVVVWLIVGGVFFTLRLKFINISGFRHAWLIIFGRFSKKTDQGEVSHFQALTTALSATVGLGNIAGVAIAISIGGPGATFWMILAGFLGMTLKFAECTLGLKYREIFPDGSVAGGPMYYLSKGLEMKKMKWLGSILAPFYAILIVLASFGGGNMLQSNQAFAQLSEVLPVFEGRGLYVGLALAILVGLVIIGGIKSIARVTSRIVPLMAFIYILAALIVIFYNFKIIPQGIGQIFLGAFSPDALKGGIIGVLITGFQRGAFSNEAGIGSASIAHSAAKTNIPAREGFVALLEPFIDTVVICTMTALIIIFSGVYTLGNMEGVALTSHAFASVIEWFPYILAIAVLLFAYSTMISWSYYGQKGFNFLFNKIFGRKASSLIYQVLFLCFVVLGAAGHLTDVIRFSDMMILALAFPNLIGLYIFVPEIIQEIRNYNKPENFQKT